MCERLARGELDVALVSSFEFLRHPVYRIADGVSISSDGPVYSVIVAADVELNAIKRVEVDPASLTSANLLRCLVGPDVEFVPLTENQSAKLLIGDQALDFRRGKPSACVIDLGDEWKQRTGLPFVFALWLIRPEVPNASEIADELRALRARNLSDIATLARTEFERRYFTEFLNYDLGARHKLALNEFADLCVSSGVLQLQHREFHFV